MIIIDGRESELSIKNFSNLEEILVCATSSEDLENRIVTDVIVNKQLFSELYPHQAEDIASEDLKSIEINSVTLNEMALNIAKELYTVVDIMDTGSRGVATLFRQADDDEALEVFQDLLEVIRDFMNMVGVLRNDFQINDPEAFSIQVAKISDLLSELTEVMENEDWILLADVLEYEFVPVCNNWKQTIQQLREDIRSCQNG